MRLPHRDYNRSGAQIMFSIYDNRVEISSPGSLIAGLSVNELEDKHETRNDIICEIFKFTKDMETFGTGIHKIRKSMKDHGLPEPEFRNERDFFVGSILLVRETIYLNWPQIFLKQELLPI